MVDKDVDQLVDSVAQELKTRLPAEAQRGAQARVVGGCGWVWVCGCVGVFVNVCVCVCVWVCVWVCVCVSVWVCV